MPYRLLSILFVCTLLNSACFATHYRGGEVTYRQVGIGQYQVSFRIYNDCSHGDANAIAQDIPLYLGVFDNQTGNLIAQDTTLTGTNQPLPLNSIPGCLNDTNHYCGGTTLLQRSFINLYKASGYQFLNQRCCIGNALNIADPTNSGITLRVITPDTGLSHNADASPAFKALPPLRLCVNTAYTIDFGATDSDGDSLAYRFETAYGGGSATDAKPFPASTTLVPLTYAAGFSYLKPLGSNGTMALDARTGIISGTCFKEGEYLVSVACDEYRNGLRLGSVTRVYVLEFSNCNKETSAMLRRDSAAIKAGMDSLGIIRCGAERRIKFQNTSTGAAKFLWDFGVAGSNTDTSSEASPEFTYPSAGLYPLTLIAYGAGCNDTLRTNVLLSDDVLTPDFNIKGSACLFDTVSLADNSNTNGSGLLASLWRVNGILIDGNPATVVFTESKPARILHTIISEHGCIASIEKMVDVRSGHIDAGNDTTVILGAELFLQAQGGTSYNWIAIPPAAFLNYVPGSAMQQPFTNVVGKDYGYVVTGKDAQGCGGSDTVHVTVALQRYVFMPSAFTPNGDGRNDFLSPKIAGFNFLSMQIYNRLGNEVYSTTNMHPGWDGRHKGQEAALDTYYWMVRVKSETSGAELVFSGDVMLVR